MSTSTTGLLLLARQLQRAARRIFAVHRLRLAQDHHDCIRCSRKLDSVLELRAARCRREQDRLHRHNLFVEDRWGAAFDFDARSRHHSRVRKCLFQPCSNCDHIVAVAMNRPGSHGVQRTVRKRPDHCK
jgi:hypothetical protein